MTEVDIEGLREVCRKLRITDRADVAVGIPYVPFFPEQWNGVLVLAESQNLSDTNKAYREALIRMSDTERIDRLYEGGPVLGIAPWDEGDLKMAVELIGHQQDRTAVSNAVPWSLQSLGRNLNPDEDLIERSRIFWRALLQVMMQGPPCRLIVTVGKIARNVVSTPAKELGIAVLPLASSSTNFLGRTSWLFDPDDLLHRYKEIGPVLDRWFPGTANPTRRGQLVFYAAHVLSVKRKHLTQQE